MDVLPASPSAPPTSTEPPALPSAPSAPSAPFAPSDLRRLVGRALRLLLTLALIVLGLYAAIWSYLFLVGALGPLGLLAYVLVAGVFVAIAAPWLLIVRGAPLRRVIVAVARWVTTPLGLSREGVVAPQPGAAEPTGLRQRLARLLGVRFVWGRMAIVWVTLGLIAASACVWAFGELLFAVVTGGAVADTDLRILNLVATLRTPTLDEVMYAFTFLASAPAIAAVTAAAAGIALLVRRYEDALLLVLAPLAGGIFVLVIKTLVARPRPPVVDARLIVDGFSFPSGHATFAATLYGTLAYVLLRGWRRYEALRVLIAVGATLVIFAIGLSRVYLGVHYPSDVLAGWAGGTFWLVLVVVAEHLWLPVSMPALPVRRRVLAVAGGILLVALAGAYLATAYPVLPPPPVASSPAPITIAPETVEATVITRLPHMTEIIFGAPQEPISLVFVGTRAQLEQAFAAAGWVATQQPEPGAVAQALVAGLTAQPDLAGPVAPSFLADQPNALAFSQPAGASFTQRHHARLWSTDVATDAGQPLWLGTASFDEGFGLSHVTLLPTHHIAPNIDAERAYLASQLVATGLAVAPSTFQLVPAESGHNFVGDPFATDGQAVLLVLES